MNFADFNKSAIKFLPRVQVTHDQFATRLVLVKSSSYKEDLKSLFSSIDGAEDLLLKNLESLTYFSGKVGDTACVLLNKAQYIVHILSEKINNSSIADLQETGAKICGILNTHKVQNVNIISSDLDAGVLKNVVYGLLLKNYRFNDFFARKSDGKNPSLEAVNIDKLSKETLGEIINLAKQTMLARHLVNYPSTDLNPESYANIISQSFDGSAVKVKIFDAEQLKNLGMNMMLAVGRSGGDKSRMVVMEYYGNPGNSDIDLAIVGKGVCFDSGGLSIKPAKAMEDMKVDMGGSAVAFSSMQAIAQSNLKVNVVALVGLVENMVDGDSYRPGDVLHSMSGQTVEVLNTDAEGRLVLGDVLYYAQKTYEPTNMVDYATLTGAVLVSFADVHAGYMCNNEDLAQKIEKASSDSGDLVWRLPLGKKYDEMIDSTVADMKNIGSGRGAGTITAGQFLGRFVNCEDKMNTKWAHIDIAGVAYDGKGGRDPRSTKGGTGHSVLLTYKLAQSLQR